MCIDVEIPAGGHGEISQNLSRTIVEIRKKPVYRHELYFDPFALFTSIQTK